MINRVKKKKLKKKKTCLIITDTTWHQVDNSALWLINCQIYQIEQAGFFFCQWTHLSVQRCHNVTHVKLHKLVQQHYITNPHALSPSPSLCLSVTRIHPNTHIHMFVTCDNSAKRMLFIYTVFSQAIQAWTSPSLLPHGFGAWMPITSPGHQPYPFTLMSGNW